MTKQCGIYKISSPSGKCYIGQSIDIKSRFYNHKSALRRTGQNKALGLAASNMLRNNNL